MATHWMCVLVQQRHHSEGAAFIGPNEDEVLSTCVIAERLLGGQTRSNAPLSRHTFRFRADLRPLLTPYALDLFAANRPDLLSQQDTDVVIAVARTLLGQSDNTPVQLDLLGQRLLNGISIGGTMKYQIAKNPLFRAQPLVNNTC